MNMKRIDQALSVNITNVASTSATLLSTIPILGTSPEASRVGNRVRYFNWQVRGVVTYDPSATSVSQADYIRVIFFYDRQTNGVSPTYSQVITTQPAGTSGAGDPPNWQNRGRFKIIRDFKIATPPISATVAAGVITSGLANAGFPTPTSHEVQLDFFKALKGKIDCQYNGVAGTSANTEAGGLYFVCQNINGTGQFIATCTSSIEFMDV
jgi:hypothetical protein